jgi:membrane-bound lytic murein transglycosylase D
LIARAAETELSEIRDLNPALKRGKTPPNYPQFEINLPPGKKEIFEKNFPNFIQKTRFKAKTHRVRSGKTLTRVATRSRVNLQELSRSTTSPPRIGSSLVQTF